MSKTVRNQLLFRTIFLLLACCVPFTGPHVWRQIDTLGVSVRYFIQWGLENPEYPWFIPAVLQAGKSLGVSPMELPIINYMTAPLFFLGPIWGRICSAFFLLLLNLGLTHWCVTIWKEQKFKDQKIDESFYLLPLVGFSFPFFGKFMPDYLSMILALCGVGLLRLKQKLPLSTLLLSLSFLLKPPSAIVMVLALEGDSLKRLKNWIPVGISIGAVIFYFTIGKKYVLNFSDGHQFFATGVKPIGLAITQVLKDFKHLFVTFNKGFLFPFAWIYLLLAHFLKTSFDLKKHSLLFIFLFLQGLAVHLISGNHPFWHNYYYIGMAPLACILFNDLLKSAKKIRWLYVLIVLHWTVQIGLENFYNLRPLFKPDKRVNWRIARECVELKKSTPEFPWDRGYSFRSSRESFPALGTCFLEKQNYNKAEYGFYYKTDSIPKRCKIIKKSQNIVLVKCAVKPSSEIP